MGDRVTSLRLVELRGVLTEVVRQAHDGLCALARTLPTLEDDDRCAQCWDCFGHLVLMIIMGCCLELAGRGMANVQKVAL